MINVKKRFCLGFQPLSSGKDSMIGVSATETLPQNKRFGKTFLRKSQI